MPHQDCIKDVWIPSLPILICGAGCLWRAYKSATGRQQWRKHFLVTQMTAFRLLMGAVAATGLAVTSAEATTIVNNDPSVHNMRIVEGDQERVVKAEPSQQLVGLCATTCKLYFDDDPEAYEIAAGDIVSIDDGQLYFEDASVRPAAPKTPEATVEPEGKAP